jgi:hypothetical protein
VALKRLTRDNGAPERFKGEILRSTVQPQEDIVATPVEEQMRIQRSFSRRWITGLALCVLATACGSDSTSPKTGLNGKWTGQLLQPKTSGNTQFDFSLNLTVGGSAVSGTAHINVLNQTQYYADFKVTGTATATTLDFTETTITAQVPPNTGGSWCLVHGILTLSADGSRLAGNWTSSSGCAPGTIVLTRG